MMWGFGPWMNGWMNAVMMIGTVIFWGAVIGILVLVARQSRRAGSDSAPPEGPTAEATLAERFSRGEIDDQECRARLAILREPHPS